MQTLESNHLKRVPVEEQHVVKQHLKRAVFEHQEVAIRFNMCGYWLFRSFRTRALLSLSICCAYSPLKRSLLAAASADGYTITESSLQLPYLSYQFPFILNHEQGHKSRVNKKIPLTELVLLLLHNLQPWVTIATAFLHSSFRSHCCSCYQYLLSCCKSHFLKLDFCPSPSPLDLGAEGDACVCEWLFTKLFSLPTEQKLP